MANGLPELSAPPRPTTGGVGRRTSVLFKKAKNGAKLFRERGSPLLNGKGPQDDSQSSTPTPPNSTASTPSSTPLSTPSKTPQKSPGPPALNEKWAPSRDTCSDSELEKTPNHTLESGERLYSVSDMRRFCCPSLRSSTQGGVLELTTVHTEDIH